MKISRKKYLDSGKLTAKALAEIERIFGVGKKETTSVACDEAHAHSYKCLYFYNVGTGVVKRLLEEIDNYKDLLDEIYEKTKEMRKPS